MTNIFIFDFMTRVLANIFPRLYSLSKDTVLEKFAYLLVDTYNSFFDWSN